jgi:hypothetical protein
MADTNTATAERTAWQQENELRTKELTDKLEAGIKDLFSSQKYKDYLKSMSRFHNYSSRNVMLIHQQLPTATRVASYRKWEDEFNRHVKKGEKSLRIFAPIEIKPEKKLMEKLDPETGAPMLDANGKVIMEEMTALTSRSIAFKLVPVFDVSQTYGEPLPQLAEDLTGNVAHYEAFLDSLRAISPLPIVFEPMNETQDGYCQFGVKIGIREGMSEIQTISAIIHEITHERLHDRDKATENAKPASKEVKEIEAESVSYVVCQKYGIETGDNSFGYLATWGSHDLNEVKASLDTIRKEANELIIAIDNRFMAICKEQGIDLSGTEKTVETPAQAQDADAPTESTYTTISATENIAGVDFTVSEVVPDVPLTIEQRNYQKLAELFPEIVSDEYYYQRSEAGAGFMPLSLEWIDTDKLSIMHTYTQNGDLMYDPMIVLEVDQEAKTATAVEFQQSNPPLYQRIDEDGIGHSIDGNGNERIINSLQRQINEFSSDWFNNIGNQGYEPVSAVLRDAGRADPSVYFNEDKKRFSLLFQYDREGTTVLNNLDRDDKGNMAMLARVDSFRNVKFHEDNLPKDAVRIIDNVKLTHEKTETEKQAAKNSILTDDKNEQTQTPAEPMPDPTITAADRDAFGYEFEGMLPLNTDRAIELFNNDHAVFLLYSDNTEAMAFEVDEIKAHDGIFGIEREDWQKSQEYRALGNKINQQQEAAIESGFTNAKEDTFAIYQIMDGAEKARDYRFEGLDYLHQRGLEVNRNNYVIVHTEPLQQGQTLEGIFQKFNDPPKDFSGHSLSVSDVIVLNQGGEVSSHFVDSFGFAELPNFLGVEKQKEHTDPVIERRVNEPPTPPTESPAPELPYIPKEEVPIYRQSADHALENDEMQAWRDSRDLNVECGRAIDKAVIDSNYEQYRYDLKTAARTVIEEYGIDRVAWIIAGNVNYHDSDGRLSSNNKEWAKGFDTPKPDIHLKTHLAVLDGFVNKFREAEKEKPSLMAALEAGERKSKAEYASKSQPGLDAPDKATRKKNTGMEV